MKPTKKLIKKILEIQLAQLKSEMNNFRNDGWVQDGYREEYKQVLVKYIKLLPSLIDDGDK